MSEATLVPVDALSPYPGNPRRGRLDVIVESLSQHGQYRPIVVNQRTMQVLAGNHTLEAAKHLGWDDIAVSYVDVDEDTAKRIVLVDNRSNDLAVYDDSALVGLLDELRDSDLGLLVRGSMTPRSTTSSQTSATLTLHLILPRRGC